MLSEPSLLQIKQPHNLKHSNSSCNCSQLLLQCRFWIHIYTIVQSNIVVILLIMAAKSKARQTKVKPNKNFDHYQASSSMAGKGKRPSQFFKIILPSTMEHMKLVLYTPLVILYHFTFQLQQCNCIWWL